MDFQLFSASGQAADSTSKLRGRLAPLSVDLLASVLRVHPWLVESPIPARTYAGQSTAISVPTAYPVLVARRDMANEDVARLLKLISSQKGSVRPHLLFQRIDPKLNGQFTRMYNFHRETIRRYKLR